MSRLIVSILLLLGLFSIARAATPTSFCKCTCFSNSTLIQLTGSSEPDTSVPDSDRLLRKAGTCDDCNRQFCLKHDLPICEGAEEEDVFTTCFQRDSAKDEAVVFLFIFTTAGLLIWALVRPYVGKWINLDRRGSFVRVDNNEQ